ncbi:MAG: efflux RND transporter periplasmic adaptor subunit [Patescibacteria group bacterium]
MNWKKITIILVIVAVICMAVIFFVFKNDNQVEYITAFAEKGELVQTVSEVGTVKAAREIELNFFQTGKLEKILVKIGDKVKAGQVLAELDYSSLNIKKEEAEANLEVAQANLNKILTGATAEDVAVKQATVDQTKAAYLAAAEELGKVEKTVSESINQAEKILADLKSDSNSNMTAYEQSVITARNNLTNTKATYQQLIDNEKEDLLIIIEDKLTDANTALDYINTVLSDGDAKYVLSVKNTTFLALTKDSRSEGLALLDTAEISLANAKAEKTATKINKAVSDALSSLEKTYEALNYCYNVLENTITTSSFTQAELDAFKTNIDTYLSTTNTSISAVKKADQDFQEAVLTYDTKVAAAEDSLAEAEATLIDAINTATNSLATARVSGDQQVAVAQSKVNNTFEAWSVAKTELTKLKSRARVEDVALARAQVKQAEASLNLIKNQIEDSIIKAPIDGNMIKVNYEIGEQVVVTKPVFSMLSENNFEIEVDVSEADIAKININNQAEITLDSFGEDVVFNGIVYFIEPAETVIQDVIYYKVKVQFTDPPSKISNVKSGMTANIMITTAKRSGIINIPGRAIIEKNGGDKYVRVLVGEKVNEISVTIGLRGDEGMVEILSGLKEGDEVVTSIKEKK